MRPRFSIEEIDFLLELLQDTEARTQQQITNLTEEQEHLTAKITELRYQLLYQDPYRAVEPLQDAREDYARVRREWLPLPNQEIVLKGLIARFQKIKDRRTGRISRTVMFAQDYLESGTIKPPKTQLPYTGY
jgi:hypothetical protein